MPRAAHERIARHVGIQGTPPKSFRISVTMAGGSVRRPRPTPEAGPGEAELRLTRHKKPRLELVLDPKGKRRVIQVDGIKEGAPLYLKTADGDFIVNRPEKDSETTRTVEFIRKHPGTPARDTLLEK